MLRSFTIRSCLYPLRRSYSSYENKVSVRIGNCSHDDFLKGAKKALTLALSQFAESHLVSNSLKKPTDSLISEKNKRLPCCRVINLYYGANIKLDRRAWRQFVKHVLSTPIGDSVELIIATQCIAVSTPEGKPSATCVNLALFSIPPTITVLPLTIPNEKTHSDDPHEKESMWKKMDSMKNSYSAGVITLPTTLSQHWTAISGKKCFAIVHLKESITSDHVLPGLRRFLPKSQIIGAGGALECRVWTKNDDECSSINHQTEGSNKNDMVADMTGILMVPRTDEKLSYTDKFNIDPQFSNLRKSAKLVSGIHIIGDPLVVTSVQGRLVTSLNNAHPLNALLSTTSHHHAIGQALVLGKFVNRKKYDLLALEGSANDPARDQKITERRMVSLSRAMVNTEGDFTERRSIEDINPIAIRVTGNGMLESLLDCLTVGDEVAILRVDNETERIRFQNMYPANFPGNICTSQAARAPPVKKGTKVKALKPKDTWPRTENAIWGFTCDSFISRDHSCWNIWNQRGFPAHGGHFRFQIYNGHEYHCSTSWCEVLGNP